jgi:hypothetical protein
MTRVALWERDQDTGNFEIRLGGIFSSKEGIRYIYRGYRRNKAGSHEHFFVAVMGEKNPYYGYEYHAVKYTTLKAKFPMLSIHPFARRG